jgi:hypothetical protein
MAKPLSVDLLNHTFDFHAGHLTASGTFDMNGGTVTIESAVISNPSPQPDVVLVDHDITITGVNLAPVLDHLL